MPHLVLSNVKGKTNYQVKIYQVYLPTCMLFSFPFNLILVIDNIRCCFVESFLLYLKIKYFLPFEYNLNYIFICWDGPLTQVREQNSTMYRKNSSVFEVPSRYSQSDFVTEVFRSSCIFTSSEKTRELGAVCEGLLGQPKS